eukprot:13630120-Alexandrium_andersonii.AAC.1
MYDKAEFDATSHGQQRWLSFAAGWVGQSVKTPPTRLFWAAAENMIVDGAATRMVPRHSRATLKRDTWANAYVKGYVKQEKSAPALAERQAHLKALAEVAARDLLGRA